MKQAIWSFNNTKTQLWRRPYENNVRRFGWCDMYSVFLWEFLEINPAGILPTLLFNKHIIRYGVVKINNFLEENVPVDIYPMMIPCTTSPALYQKYLFFTSKIQSINLTALEAGHLLYGKEVDTTEAITHFDLQEEIRQMGQIAGLSFSFFKIFSCRLCPKTGLSHNCTLFTIV